MEAKWEHKCGDADDTGSKAGGSGGDGGSKKQGGGKQGAKQGGAVIEKVDSSNVLFSVAMTFNSLQIDVCVLRKLLYCLRQ
jgi:hypothetical protein